MELDKKDIYNISNYEPTRIEHVKLEKYAQEEYAESAYRVKIDNAETKFCWCSICKSIYSADKKHLMGNIRTHWNGHRSRKRVVQNTLDNFVSKKSKISISESEIAEFRRCAAQALCESALPISFFESAGAQTLFDAVQSKLKFLIIGYESYMYLELLKLNDDVRKALTPLSKLDCDKAKISNVVELLLDMVETLCQVKNDSYKKIKLPLQSGIHGPARPVHDFLSLSFAGLADLNGPGTSDISKN